MRHSSSAPDESNGAAASSASATRSQQEPGVRVTVVNEKLTGARQSGHSGDWSSQGSRAVLTREERLAALRRSAQAEAGPASLV